MEYSLRYCLGLVTLLLLSLFPAEATTIAADSKKETTTWPRIVSSQNSSDCDLVLEAARIAFQSKEPDLPLSASAVQEKDKNLILWRKGWEDFGFDDAFIEVRKVPTSNGTLYLQKTPSPQPHFAVRQTPFNSEGDQYDLMVLKNSDNKSIEWLQSTESEAGKTPTDIQIVLSSTWQNPWLFHNPATGHCIAIDTQPPYTFLADWIIYGVDKGTAKSIGRIAFKPNAVHAIQIIPQGPLHTMEVLLDQIIGPAGKNEGTFHATDRLRLDVENMWANLLYRPWAMAQPTNTRKRVDAGLKQWQKGSLRHQAQYKQLQALYPQALAQLTQHYLTTLHKSQAQAAQLAAKSLDLALRSHFSFGS